jgi:A/G-specific adenine glycosylase
MSDTSLPTRSQRATFRRAMTRVEVEGGDRFPWRSSRDPYVLLLAEVLLQRTRGPNVAAHFERIVSEFPTAPALAMASISRIAREIAPLGLRKRATILKRLGEELVTQYGGVVPPGYEELLALPGVGPYAANALQCFSYGRRTAIVDAGIARILRRYFDRPHERRVNADRDLWALARLLLPAKGADRHNLALLTVAQNNCLTKPRCENCVLHSSCSFARDARRG